MHAHRRGGGLAGGKRNSIAAARRVFGAQPADAYFIFTAFHEAAPDFPLDPYARFTDMPLSESASLLYELLPPGFEVECVGVPPHTLRAAALTPGADARALLGMTVAADFPDMAQGSDEAIVWLPVFSRQARRLEAQFPALYTEGVLRRFPAEATTMKTLPTSSTRTVHALNDALRVDVARLDIKLSLGDVLWHYTRNILDDDIGAGSYFGQVFGAIYRESASAFAIPVQHLPTSLGFYADIPALTEANGNRFIAGMFRPSVMQGLAAGEMALPCTALPTVSPLSGKSVFHDIVALGDPATDRERLMVLERYAEAVMGITAAGLARGVNRNVHRQNLDIVIDAEGGAIRRIAIKDDEDAGILHGRFDQDTYGAYPDYLTKRGNWVSEDHGAWIQRGLYHAMAMHLLPIGRALQQDWRIRETSISEALLAATDRAFAAFAALYPDAASYQADRVAFFADQGCCFAFGALPNRLSSRARPLMPERRGVETPAQLAPDFAARLQAMRAQHTREAGRG